MACHSVWMTLTRRQALALLAVPAYAALGGCGSAEWSAVEATRVNLATGNRGGVFVRYGIALASVLRQNLDGVTTRVVYTDASVDNARRVGSGNCQIGFCLGDAAADALAGQGAFDRPIDLVALTRMYDSFLHVVVRADSPIRSVSDLRGRKVAIGPPVSGTRVTAIRVLAESGIDIADITASSPSLNDSADALRRGELDALFFVSGIPNAAILSLSRQTPIRLIDLGALVDPMVAAYGPQYVVGPVPTSKYRLPDPVNTVSVKNYLIAARDLPEDLAYAITRVTFEQQTAIQRLAPEIRQPTPGAAIFTSPLDLHPGALRYFREQGR